MASGSLFTKIHKGLTELATLGLIEERLRSVPRNALPTRDLLAGRRQDLHQPDRTRR